MAPRRKRKPGRARGGALRDDDAGIGMVIEAVIVAVIVLSALIFVALLRHGDSASFADTGDSQRVAQGLASALAQKSALTCNLEIEQWVSQAINGTDCGVSANIAASSTLVPRGAFWIVRLDNGQDTLPLLPLGLANRAQPTNARVAETYFVPNWRAFNGSAATVSATLGATVSTLGATSLASPTGSCVGPSGATWLSLFGGASAAATVPANAPLGKWRASAAGCGGVGTTIQVTSAQLPAGSNANLLPVYGLQVVVWYPA